MCVIWREEKCFHLSTGQVFIYPRASRTSPAAQESYSLFHCSSWLRRSNSTLRAKLTPTQRFVLLNRKMLGICSGQPQCLASKQALRQKLNFWRALEQTHRTSTWRVLSWRQHQRGSYSSAFEKLYHIHGSGQHCRSF